MILELLEFVSAVGGSSIEMLCKFCYGDEENDGWLRPCKCSGTLKWVHRSCFDQWMKKAPALQQTQCQTCRYTYEKTWVLKPVALWCRPPLEFSTWECIEVLLDVYSTYKFMRGFLWTYQGKRSIWVQILHLFFWRTFIGSNRRIGYYRSLSVTAMTSLFEIRVKDFDGNESNNTVEGGNRTELALEPIN